MQRSPFRAFTPFEGVPACTQEEWERDMELTRAHVRSLDRRLLETLYRRLPPDERVPFGWQRRPASYTVILSVSGGHGDSKRWLHVSLAHPGRLPAYEELTEVKRVFVGLRRQALMILPREERHVNLHPYCLHLWCCLDGDGLPDFGAGGSI